jgi:ribosomal protein S18 acetylase RimI-like enzyme
MSLELRPAGLQDEPFLYQLAYERFCDELRVDLWPPAMREPLLKLQIEGQRSSYAAAFPCADHGIIMLYGRPVGRLLIDRGPDAHHIVDILLAKEHRAKGVGSAILRAICKEADLMRKPLRLSVGVSNRAAGLYRSLGFRPIQTVEDRWLMERPPVTDAP